MTTKRTRETLLACWSGTTDAPGRAALGILVNAIRRDAPSVDVHDIPADQLDPEETATAAWPEPPVRVAVPLALTDGTDVAEALEIARRHDPAIRWLARSGRTGPWRRSASSGSSRPGHARTTRSSSVSPVHTTMRRSTATPGPPGSSAPCGADRSMSAPSAAATHP